MNDSLRPCAACRMLRRRCADKCMLAPYFPPDDPHKFATAHRVFGASNIIKNLQELPREQRGDAVNSMVYEASARMRDPVYGCAGAIWQLQQQVSQLQAQLATAQAELLNVHWHHTNLLAFVTAEDMPETMSINPCKMQVSSPDPHDQQHMNALINISSDEEHLVELWEPLWT